MRGKAFTIALGTVLMSMFAIPSWADQQTGHSSSGYAQDHEAQLPNGVIGAVIRVRAERIGEPATLYVIKVHHDGPAQQAGLRHGDEIVAVNGVPVKGQSYEQVISMIRGEAGAPVKLEVRGIRELSIMRVDGTKLMKEGQSSKGESQSGKSEP
jgi:S1-C subfamily serine protease